MDPAPVPPTPAPTQAPAPAQSLPLASLVQALVKPAAAAAGGSIVKSAATFYGATIGIVVAVCDLKFGLGLGHSFDAGLIGAALSMLFGKTVSL